MRGSKRIAESRSSSLEDKPQLRSPDDRTLGFAEAGDGCPIEHHFARRRPLQRTSST
jgi:hypothetical protein